MNIDIDIHKKRDTHSHILFGAKSLLQYNIIDIEINLPQTHLILL